MTCLDRFNALSKIIRIKNDASGLLAKKTLAVKENIDVAGHISTNGHPLWAATHDAATSHASVVDALLVAGAQLVATTHMDEMAYSLLGANPHYGAPLNPVDANRHPGGSSSGSAVAVATKLVDIALGTDTGGSCRAPASFCGVFGMRTSHAAIDMTGVIPMARSLDAIGWFARDIDMMITTGDVLLPEDQPGKDYEDIIFIDEIFENIEPDVQHLLTSPLRFAQNKSRRCTQLDKDFFSQALMHFRNLQGHEVWQTHQQWIRQHRPVFAKGVGDRLTAASEVLTLEKNAARDFILSKRGLLENLFNETGVIIAPTTPILSPRLDEPETELDIKRYLMIRYFSLASLFGLPEISIPICADNKCAGLSFIGRRGSDRKLLAFTKNFLQKL
jgi:amidase